ncbi:MAG: CoA-binding protein [Anaerolineales bacterium]
MNHSYQDERIIQDILKTTHTIAVVGLSSEKSKAGYYVPAYLQRQGYRIIPVNPHIDRALGEKAYPDLASIPEPVDLVLLFRRSQAVPPFVEQAIQIGAKGVWMQSGIINRPAAQMAERAGLQVIMNACMFVEHRRMRRSH